MKSFVFLAPLCLAISAGTCRGCGKKDMRSTKDKKDMGSPHEQAVAQVGGKNDKGQPAADKLPRKIIYTAMINLIVEDFAKADQDLIQLVKAHKGYVIKSEVSGTPGTPRTGQWQVRVPVEQFDPFPAPLAQLGEPERSPTDSQDGTEAFFDVEARIKTKKAEEASLPTLLETATGTI